MYHEYPYTTYYEDIDKLCKCCRALKFRLDTHGDYLRLINDKNEVLSSVQVSYAEKALTDKDGNPIQTYLISAGTNGTHLVFTKGNNEVISFEVPFAQTAAKDVQDKDILDYVYGVSISGKKVRITNGDGTVYELTVPFATHAAETVDGIDLTMLAMSLITDGNELVLQDTRGRELSRITPNFAVKAQKDVDGDDIKSTYGNTLAQSTTTLKLIAKDGTVLSEQTINYAVTALKDTDGNLFLSDYAEKIVVDNDGKRIGVEAHDGTRLATITVPFATLATDATNAVENVQVIGDQIVLTTYGGQTFAITAPYAIKAQKDDLNNTIKNTYFAGVDNDTDAGTISFYDATGTLLATISNGVITHAIYDDYDNPLAGYIKTLAATAGSDYLTATHGDGTVDSITVDYATRAWKDTNNNVIKNTYVKRLAIAQDPDDGQWKLFAFNGDNPEALLFALVIVAEKAYKDVNGKLLTSYLANAELDTNTFELVTKDGEGNEVDRIDLTHLPYGYTLNINANKELELLDPDGNVLSSVSIPAHTYQLSDRNSLGMKTGEICLIEDGTTDRGSVYQAIQRKLKSTYVLSKIKQNGTVVSTPGQTFTVPSTGIYDLYFTTEVLAYFGYQNTQVVSDTDPIDKIYSTGHASYGGSQYLNTLSQYDYLGRADDLVSTVMPYYDPIMEVFGMVSAMPKDTLKFIHDNINCLNRYGSEYVECILSRHETFRPYVTNSLYSVIHVRMTLQAGDTLKVASSPTASAANAAYISVSCQNATIDVSLNTTFNDLVDWDNI